MHLIYCLLLLACHIIGANSLSNNETVAILMAFKRQMSSEFYEKQAGWGLFNWNWKNSAKVCRWVGITCNSRGHVVKLNMSYGIIYPPLHGTITPALGRLSSLTHIGLESVTLEGTMPPELGMLYNLQTLDMSSPYNRLKGGIPAEFGRLINLKFLSIWGLGDGEIPAFLGNFTALQHLSLVGSMTGEIPVSVGNLTDLQELCLQGLFNGTFPHFWRLHQLRVLHIQSPNFRLSVTPEVANLSALSEFSVLDVKLTAPLPPQLGWLQYLTILNLQNNSLSGKLPWLANCTSLVHLALRENDLHGSIEDLGHLQHLSSLDLSYNQLTGRISSWLANCTGLTQLVLTNNYFTGSVEGLRRLHRLTDLDLSSNRLSGRISSWLGNLTLLNFIQLESNEFTGSLPAEIGNLDLLEVHLSINNLSGMIPATIANCSSLAVLILSENGFTGSIPPDLSTSLMALNFESNNLEGTLHLEDMVYLEYISMANNLISAVSISNCSQLALADFKRNRLKGNIPDFWGSIYGLRVLSLGYNLLEGSIPSWVENMSQLQVLDFSNNKLQGEIPLQISKMKAFNFTEDQSDSSYFNGSGTLYYHLDLETKSYSYVLKSTTVIDLSNNALTGSIPADIGDLRGLRFLNLSHNMLNGSIPESISRMLILEQIDFSHNQLSGQIPQKLSKLTKLNSLDLSFNQLSGPIPGGQFQTFKPASYEHNKGLCGIPLQACNFSAIAPGSSILESETRAKWHDVSWVAFTIGHLLGLLLALSFLCHR